MGAIHPRWGAWSYLLYAGGLTLLFSASGLLTWFSGHYHPFKYTVLSFLVLLVFAFVARSLWRDGRHPIAAGLFAYTSVWLFGAFVAALYNWFGWLDLGGSGSPFSGFNLARLTLVLFTLLAALTALRRFRFPLLMLTIVQLSWFFITDLISGGGDWSAVVTFVVGLGFLVRARSADAGPDRVYGMWLHVGAGLTIGGSLLWFLHHGHFEWALIVVAGLLFVRLADAFERASWAILGSIGILAAATHYAVSWSHTGSYRSVIGGVVYQGTGSRGWVPSVVFGAAGGLLMVLGGLLANKRRTASVSP
jgi:hypothetical protein